MASGRILFTGPRLKKPRSLCRILEDPICAAFILCSFLPLLSFNRFLDGVLFSRISDIHSVRSDEVGTPGDPACLWRVPCADNQSSSGRMILVAPNGETC